MKKIIGAMGVILLILAILIVILLIKGASSPAVPENYTETVKTGGAIEAGYLQNGGYSVGYHEASVLENYKKYEVWYPEEMTAGNKKYPLIKEREQGSLSSMATASAGSWRAGLPLPTLRVP